MFNEKLAQSECTGVSLKPLCTTRWTARTAAIEAVLKDYSILMDAMQEIHGSTRDEYGLKANGILTALEKFCTLFGLKLGYLLFGAAENVSKCLQAKDISVQEALSAVNLASRFYRRQRTDESFNKFYDDVVESATDLNISSPQIPRYRRAPSRFDDGCPPHHFASPRSYFRSIYFEACDILLQELDERFDQQQVLPSLLALEGVIIKSANNENYKDELKLLEDSCYADDLDFKALRRHLPLVCDVVKEASPTVRKVTSVRTVCDAMNTNSAYKSMLPEVHKLLRLYLTVPLLLSERSQR